MISDRMLAEDIVQETLLDVWRNVGSYIATRGSARSWLLHIAVHQAIKLRHWREREAARVRKCWEQAWLSSPLTPPGAPWNSGSPARQGFP